MDVPDIKLSIMHSSVVLLSFKSLTSSFLMDLEKENHFNLSTARSCILVYCSLYFAVNQSNCVAALESPEILFTGIASYFNLFFQTLNIIYAEVQFCMNHLNSMHVHIATYMHAEMSIQVSTLICVVLTHYHIRK